MNFIMKIYLKFIYICYQHLMDFLKYQEIFLYSNDLMFTIFAPYFQSFLNLIKFDIFINSFMGSYIQFIFFLLSFTYLITHYYLYFFILIMIFIYFQYIIFNFILFMCYYFNIIIILKQQEEYFSYFLICFLSKKIKEDFDQHFTKLYLLIITFFHLDFSSIQSLLNFYQTLDSKTLKDFIKEYYFLEILVLHLNNLFWG